MIGTEIASKADAKSGRKKSYTVVALRFSYHISNYVVLEQKYKTRKHQLCGYNLSELTHKTAWSHHNIMVVHLKIYRCSATWGPNA